MKLGIAQIAALQPFRGAGNPMPSGPGWYVSNGEWLCIGGACAKRARFIPEGAPMYHGDKSGDFFCEKHAPPSSASLLEAS